MQKKLIALAVAGLVSGSAFANNVTVYGVADVTFDVVSTSGGTVDTVYAPGTATFVLTPNSNTGPKTGSYTRVSSNSSYIGFKGSEDLGNGLKAVFQFEHSVAVDNNAGLAGGRDSYAGLVGGFGAIKLGTLTTATRALGGKIDVNAGNTGIGDSKALINVSGYDTRQSNTLAYVSPAFSGFQAEVDYISGEAKTINSTSGTGTQRNPNAWDLGLTYNNGPILVGLTYANGRQRDIADTEVKNIRLAGAYNFGPGSVRLLWNSAKNDTKAYTLNGANIAGTNAKVNVWGIGGTFNVTPNGKLIAQYYKAKDSTGSACTGVAGNSCDNGSKLFEIGYEHSMSKRTILKAVIAQINNDAYGYYNFGTNGVNNVGVTAVGGVNVVTNPGVDPRGIQVGIRHSF